LSGKCDGGRRSNGGGRGAGQFKRGDWCKLTGLSAKNFRERWSMIGMGHREKGWVDIWGAPPVQFHPEQKKKKKTFGGGFRRSVLRVSLLVRLGVQEGPPVGKN